MKISDYWPSTEEPHIKKLYDFGEAIRTPASNFYMPNSLYIRVRPSGLSPLEEMISSQTRSQHKEFFRRFPKRNGLLSQVGVLLMCSDISAPNDQHINDYFEFISQACDTYGMCTSYEPVRLVDDKTGLFVAVAGYKDIDARPCY